MRPARRKISPAEALQESAAGCAKPASRRGAPPMTGSASPRGGLAIDRRSRALQSLWSRLGPPAYAVVAGSSMEYGGNRYFRHDYAYRAGFGVLRSYIYGAA